MPVSLAKTKTHPNYPVLFTYYYLTLNIKEDAEAYAKIQAERDAQLKTLDNKLWESQVFNAYSSSTQSRDFQKKLRDITDFNPNEEHGSRSQVIELETSHLFNNQWNTAPIPGVTEKGLRVFHAMEYVFENKNVKEGYFLTLSPAFLHLLQSTHVCGYCGKQEPAQKGHVFCPHCLDSEYLTVNDLHLTRMKAVSDKSSRDPLTQDERDNLIPLYKQAQIHGNSERRIKQIQKTIEDLHNKRRKIIQNIEDETSGFLWLIEHGIKTDNVIYYNHKSCFTFGWRKPVDDCYLSELLDVISEFNYPYEIVKQNGEILKAT